MDANLSLDLVRVVEAAAVAAAHWVGKGDDQAADAAAAQAMRLALRRVGIQGKVVVGDGPRGATSVLFIGETVGMGGTPADVAADPLECITRAARAAPEALSAIAIAEPGGLLHAPAVSMEKISVGPRAASANLDLDAPPGDVLRSIAAALGKPASEVTACLLDRPRHGALTQALRDAGGRVKTISDGDIVGAISPALPDTGVDFYIGVGGAPEGVLAAAALRGMGGRMVARFAPRNEEEKNQVTSAGAVLGQVYQTEQLASGQAIFAAAGVTKGLFLDGVRLTGTTAETHAVVIRAGTGSVRWIRTHHRLDEKGAPRA